MKKLSASIMSGLLLLPLVAFAQTTTEWTSDDEGIFEILNNSAQATSQWAFGFSEQDNIIQITDVTDTTATVTIPVVKDNNEAITEYQLSYGTAPLVDLQANKSYDNIKQKVCAFTTEQLQNKTEIECALEVGSDIQSDQVYYITAFPKKNGNIGTPSKEITLNHSDLVKKGKQPQPTTDTAHSAAPDMCAANISRSQDNDKVTVTWTAQGTGNLRIEARGSNENTFKTVGNAKVSAESFTFTPSKSGTYLVKLIPLTKDNIEHGKACTQTMQIQDFTITTINTKTWPKETLIIIGLIAVIGWYVLLRRKA